MSSTEANGGNEPQIKYWNGPAGEKWARLVDVQDRMLGAMGSAAMDACDIRAGNTVLDVGCGSGSTSIEIASEVGDGGHVIGLDISTPMLDVGRAKLSALGISNVQFKNQDAATYHFDEAGIDRVYSRFGVMFFADPIGAFANIRTGLKSGGRLAFVCWQAADKNPWIEIPMNVVLQYVPAPSPVEPDAPGPNAFASRDRVRNILSAAGFEDIVINPFKTAIFLGVSVPEAVETLIDVGPTSRLLKDVTEDVATRIRADLSDAIAGYHTDGGVKIDSTTWVVSAVTI